MSLTISREYDTARWLVELASDRLSDDELEALVPLFLAASRRQKRSFEALALPHRQPALLRSA